MPSRGCSAALIVVVCGPGGVGKGTIIQHLLQRDRQLWLSRSWTTRARRPTEAPDAYTFVDKPTFEANARAGGFLESATVLGELYGTPIPDAPSGMDVLLEIDVQGASQVLTRCNDVVCILLLPPSEADQYERLVGRGDSEARARQRLELGRQEAELGREIAGYIVVNEEIGRTVDEFLAIIEKERAARSSEV